jgi:ATP-dependent helicase HepA
MTAPNSPAALFAVTDLVALRSDPRTVMPIIEVLPGTGERRYRVFQNNTKAVYYESQLRALAEKTEDRRTLTADEMHAHLTSLQLLSPSTANLYSLRSGRIAFVPYQYRPVLKLIRSDRPRLLIADEVGVGKTIEAGLIIKELRARMDLDSVLIICPKPLVAERKWFLEMKRFDEHFTALDGPLLRHCLRETYLDGEWPEQYSRALLPFSLFDSELIFGGSGRGRSKDQGLLNLDPPPKFDLVIVDEAHHIRNPETYLHQGVRYFCDNAQAVLFLTATPVQLGSEDLFTLLNVLRPDLVIDVASFAQMAEPNGYINLAVHHCRAAAEGWQDRAKARLDEAARTEWGRLFLRKSPEFHNAYDRLQEEEIGDAERVSLIRLIEEFYTFSALINRTRRRDIGGFTTRKAETVTVEFTPAQRQLHDDLLDVIARILAFCHGAQNVRFIMTTIRRQAASFDPVVWLRSLYTNADQQLVCQICKEEMPFRGRDGEYYLEAVEALTGDHFPKEHEAQFLALCPLCAAMYTEFVKRDEGAMESFKSEVIKSEEPEIALQLGVVTTSVRFVDVHFRDLKTIVGSGECSES